MIRKKDLKLTEDLYLVNEKPAPTISIYLTITSCAPNAFSTCSNRWTSGIRSPRSHLDMAETETPEMNCKSFVERPLSILSLLRS